MTVAALYIDPRGPYPKLLGPELCWDEKRDARTYSGPWPVVAHPPCGPWGRLRRFCTRQSAELGPIAVDQVRRFGGVLEHPWDSKLWPHLSMPLPEEFEDKYGGFTAVVDQVAWGHPARKRTWLYIVGVSPSEVYEACKHYYRSTREPTHVVTTSRGKGPRLPEMKKADRHITPVAFAEWLVALARQARQQRAEVA